LPDVEVAPGAQPLPTAGLLGNLYMVEATADLGAAGRAGLTFGLSTERGKGFAVLLDRAGGPEGQVSLVTTPGLEPIQNRWWPVAREGPHRLRLTVVDEMLEAYVDDVLVLNRHVPELRAGPLGLLAEGEAAKVAQVRVREGR